MVEQHGITESKFFQQVEQWLEEVQTPPLFLNAVSGLGSPLWCAHENSRFDQDANLPEQAVAVLESIIFLLILNMEVMHEILPKAQGISVSGGLANLKGFCQKLADISGLKVQRNDETEGTARGLAYLLTDCNGEWPVSYSIFKPATDTELANRYSNWIQFVRNNVSEDCLYFQKK